MAGTAFPERRTRSQVTLPDAILSIPECSPLKVARTAIRNRNTATSNAEGESDDDVFLAAGKTQPHMNNAINTKRSASPPARNEYQPPSSPSEGPELKRVRLSGTTVDDDVDHKGHSRTHSEPKALSKLRLALKSSPRKGKKPTSNASASPPPTHFSPAPVSPSKARAQSVPVLPATQVKVDFTKLYPSPRKGRARSRSPSKELRIVPSSKLSTIQDDVEVNMINVEIDTSGASSSDIRVQHVDVDMEPAQQEKGSRISEMPGTPLARKQVDISDAAGEIVPASPSLGEMAPASPTPRQVLVSSPPTVNDEVIPASPPTYSEPRSFSMNSKILATPYSSTLDYTIPMSPLTPVPETPMPGRYTSSAEEGRRHEGMGWGLEPMKELVPATQVDQRSGVLPSTSMSRLPRLSVMAPPAMPLKTSRASHAPSILTTGKKPTFETKTSIPSTPGAKTPVNPFDLMMKAARGTKAKDVTAKASAVNARVGKTVPSVKDKGTSAAESLPKPKKLKEKMRPRQKREPEAPSPIVPDPEDEDEEPIEEAAAQTSLDDLPPAIGEALSAATGTTREPGTDPAEGMVVDAPLPEAVGISMDRSTDNTHLEHLEISHPESVTSQPANPDETQIPQPAQNASDASNIEANLPLMELSMPQIHTEIDEQPVPLDPPHVLQQGKGKAPLGKQRQPSIPIPVRVTRSSSNKKNGEMEATPNLPPKKLPVRSLATTDKKAATASMNKKRAPVAENSRNTDSVNVASLADDEERPLPPGSPMRISPVKLSPKVSSSSMDDNLTIPSTPAASSNSTVIEPELPPASPSPTKIARSTVLAMKLQAGSAARTFGSSSLHSAPNSSLSTLSNALEKLRMPAPSRPNTSMGFNREATGDDNVKSLARSKDDVTVGRASIGLGRKSGAGLQRATTLGASAFKSAGKPVASSSKATASSSAKAVQKPISMFMSGKGGATKPGSRMGAFGGKPSIFGGMGGGVRRTVSKKTTLPVVIGSPVKGGAADNDNMQETRDSEDEDDKAEGEDGGKIYNAIMNGSSATELLTNLLAQGPQKGKDKEISARPAHSSRRVSMLSRDLTQSLNEPQPPLPPPVRGTMGPPATPPTSGRVLNMGSGSGSSASGSPSVAGPSGATRSSARIANAAPSKAKAGNDGPISAGKKAAAAAEMANPAKTILKDCVIFVDVKSEDGDEAGSLFVEMLEGVGARVLTRVGQSCTHIVFKNGLTSTITRYKLLRDPKPLVVGIGWVVECIEQRALVEESPFLIDLEHTNIAGTNKRRRSMLPRLFAEEAEHEEFQDGDRSMDGSVSSITMDDDLTPLEKARLRKSKQAVPQRAR